jgi:hypothetical protein
VLWKNSRGLCLDAPALGLKPDKRGHSVSIHAQRPIADTIPAWSDSSFGRGGVLQKAPKNWDQLNLEAVIEANVIEGHPGPPTVVAVETW